eukprot:scaffold42334_cov65-Phaeocystis_antarctica.AAC.3
MRRAAGSTPKPKPKPRPRPKPKPNPTPTSPNTPQAAPTRGGAVLEQQSSTKRCACIRLGARENGSFSAFLQLAPADVGLLAQMWQSRPAAWSRCPSSQQLPRTPTTPEAQMLAQGCPQAPSGEPPPLGCRRQAALALGACPKPPIKRPLSI